MTDTRRDVNGHLADQPVVSRDDGAGSRNSASEREGELDGLASKANQFVAQRKSRLATPNDHNVVRLGH